MRTAYRELEMQHLLREIEQPQHDLTTPLLRKQAQFGSKKVATFAQ